MNWLQKLWYSLTAEKALLKAELERLRETNAVLEDENRTFAKELRAALNTLLSQAGVAPLPPAEETKVAKGRMRHLTWQQRQRLYAAETAPKEQAIGPTIRRDGPLQ